MDKLFNHVFLSLRTLCAMSLLLTLGAWQPAFAQNVVTIVGKVNDCSSDTPLIGADVTLIGSDKRKTVSDDQGHYSIQAKAGEKVKLKVKYIGYKEEVRELDMPAKGNIACDFCLTAEAATLDVVTVVGKSEVKKLRDSGMPISVVSQKQLSGTASNINDVLARTVGVTIRNTGGVGSASRLSVRGLEGKRMGMFIDDAPLGQMGNFVALNDIPTNMIERIEVYKGIVPYKFGGSALGGAVNVVTKEYPPVYFDVAYEIGSFNSHQLSTVFKRTDRKTGLQFGLGGVFTYSANNYNMRLVNQGDRIVKRNHDKFNKVIGGTSIKATKWWFDEIKWELIYMHTHQQLQGIDYDIREAYNFSRNIFSALKFDRENFFLDGLDFTLDLAYSFGRNGLVDKAMYRYDWDGNRLPPVSPYGGEQSTHPSDGDNKSHDLMGKLNMNYLLNEHHTLNLNIYAGNTNMYPKDELMDKALGFSANFHSRMTNATLGLSHDLTLFDGKLQNALTFKTFFYSSKSRSINIYAISEPTLVKTSKYYFGFSDALRYRITKEFMAKASFNDEVRIPTTEELIGNGYSILPSPALKPERTTGCNLGLLYRKEKRDGGILEIELNSFFNTLKEMIRFTPDMIPTMARYRNFGAVRTMGVELEAKGDVLPMIYLYANGTYQDLRDIRDTNPGTTVPNATKNKRIPNVPYLMANFGAEFHKENLFGGRGQNTRVLFDAAYIHQYFYDFEMNALQDRKIPTSFTMDAGVEHSFADDKITLSFKVKNLTDKRVVSEFNCPLPGRSLAFKVRYILR